MKSRAGAALLEVIAAMTLLMIGGIAGASLIAQVAHSVAEAERIDRETASASAVLGRIGLWSRDRLVSAEGESIRFEFVVSIQHLAPTLFRVSVRRTGNRSVVVESVFHKPEASRVPGG